MNGWVYNDGFIANLLQSLSVKVSEKSVLFDEDTDEIMVSPFTWWVNTERLPRPYTAAYVSSWSIVQFIYFVAVPF